MLLLKPVGGALKATAGMHLHFTMLLLKQDNFFDKINPTDVFTFHYASIKTKIGIYGMLGMLLNLHFTMLLLKLAGSIQS